jgi:predicted nucleotidyltransferase
MAVSEADTSLSPSERTLLESFAAELRAQLGDGLRAVWLFGSRARGEPPAHEDSDVDLLVLVDDASWDAQLHVQRLLAEVAEELDLGGLEIWFSIHVHTPTWLAERRSIKSFFVAEVDQDKVVIEGSE